MARKLGRTTDARLALLRNLATDLIIHERVETTEANAKQLQSKRKKLIRFAKRRNPTARRQGSRFLYHKNKTDESKRMVQTSFKDIATRYEDRQGGYTRVLKLGP